MPIRYYLVPFETDEKKLLGGAQPMHLDVFGEANGLISKRLEHSGGTGTKWMQDYYVVRVERKDEADFTEIEKLTDILKLDASTDLAKLTTLGMDTSLVANRDDMDRVVTKWLINDERILSEVLP